MRIIKDIFDTWLEEFKNIFKDEGVLLFFVFLPIAYPLIYSWIYNNEVVREVPVVLVDDSHSALSREFAQKFDASPDVSIAYKSQDINEAQKLIGSGDAYGILYFPRDFATKVGRMEQTHVSVYCDMSYMLTYKAIYQTAMSISSVMGAEIQAKVMGSYTSRESEISSKPLDFEEVPIFNTTGGYGNFVLPGVLVLIIQQAMVLGVGMLTGTRREKHIHAATPLHHRPHRILIGRAMSYITIFSVMIAWTTLIVPKLFGFVSMVHGWDLLQFFTPYLLSCAFISILLSSLIRYRESVMLVVVFTSLPLLFMSGMSWPQSAIPSFWQGISWLFPSTFAIRGFLRMNSMGALLPDVATEYHALWIQTVVYCFGAMFVTWRAEVRNAIAQIAEREESKKETDS